MRNVRSWGVFFSVVLLIFSLILPCSVQAQTSLLEIAESRGQVRVIVGLKLPGPPYQFEAELPGKAAVGLQRAAIARAQRELQDDLLPYQAQIRRTYVTIPFISLSVDPNALEHLLNSHRVTSIEEVQEYAPTLQSTGQLIGSTNTWAANFGGQGYSVAIIDTGIDNDHPFFGGGGGNGDVNRVVDEACFSDPGAASLCPNGNDVQYGPGAAHVDAVANCYDDLNPATGNQICDHGSHVAGIAAGQDDGTRSYDGVAAKAGIVAILAAHRTEDCDPNTGGNQPCATFWSDDTIAGLDWVRQYSTTYNNVAAVNMSLGGGFHFQPCTSEAERTAIQNLKAAGIATVISAGNNHWTWATGSPGCIPEAVTVSSVYDSAVTTMPTGNEVGNQNRAPDDVRHNMAWFVDLMAVGWDLDSSVPDNAWGSKGGTSMAAPQVTGAFAVIKSIAPDKTVDEIEQLLKDTGVLVMDQRPEFPVSGDADYPVLCDPPGCQPRTGQVKPRLQLDAAVAAITSADLDIFKDCKPDGTKPVGENALCHIKITNNGPWAAMAVQMVDSYLTDGSVNFILGTIVVSPAGAATCTKITTPTNNQKVTCDLGGMQAGEIVEITVPVQADQPLNVNNEAVVSSITPDPNLSNNRATDSLNFGLAEADVVVTKTCKPSLGELPFHVGDENRGSVLPYCEIIATNHGPAAAEGVVLKDIIVGTGPFSITSIVTTGVVCVGTGGPFTTRTITCDPVASLAKDASISLRVTYNATQAVAINDTAEVTTTGSLDPDPDNNQAQGSVQILGTADLSITKSALPEPVIAGTNLTYTLTVNNAGPSPAEAVTVTDVLPAGMSLVSVTPSVGSCGAGTTNCNLGNLASGASASITIVIKVLPDTRGLLHNSAEVSSATYDWNNGNNKATAVTTVNAEADISVMKYWTSNIPVVAGAQIDYQVSVTNGGPSTATKVTLIDTLPPWVTFVSSSPACVENPTDQLTCDLGTFQPNEQMFVYITVKLDPATPDRTVICNTALAFGAEEDPIRTNNEYEVCREIVTRADIWIDKVGNFPTGNPSGTIRYDLYVYNKPACEQNSGSGNVDPSLDCWNASGGPSDAQNVVVTDTLPLDPKTFIVQYVSPNCVYNSTLHTVTCTVADTSGAPIPLPAGSVAGPFQIQAVVKGSRGTFSNTATVRSDTTDPLLVNNTDVVRTTVQGGTGKKGGGR